MVTVETDYLVVGAGASGMAFTDALLVQSDADVVLVDRRHAPGGHWNDAYPFVRLHQPSAVYGVNSRPLGDDVIDEVGPNEGFYERATAAEICDYYQRVLQDHLLASGRVRFFGMCDYDPSSSNGHRFVSRLTGQQTEVRVRRKFVDATYTESSVPSTHTPRFDIDPEVRFVTPNELVGLSDPGTGYTVIGAGKTAMDTCVWLLDSAVAPESIRWIRPRDAWILDRRFMQPLAMLPSFIEGLSLQFEAAAEAHDEQDLFRRLEASETFVRIDTEVQPEIYRGAILSANELEALRTIRKVVRLGRVLHISTESIILEEGSIPTDAGQVHVDCTAPGLNIASPHTIFEPDRITVQPIQYGIAPFSSAMIGYLEGSRDDDHKKNRLAPSNWSTGSAGDWLRATYITQLAHAAWRQEPDVAAWLDGARLNMGRGIKDHLGDPQMSSALARVGTYLEPALTNLRRLCGVRTHTPTPW